ncbi:MAG TPA: bifunctional phosphopantothenoylcysteine decarboxylase/phosphopantothenate--cysteine ligase CoaBC [Polyangiales bacterium]|jgi:phosphopantothenoylcysteine decarboxylase/phosphopantothenate--cysteine ligase|nr:bifunctional phosphopantothenoylcysteine decarboxylase/phosphopantothenate--cysteine ligase CoaBC [Polyangiales bacterium]
MSLRDKNILVCVGGGIAAFKVVDLVRELQRRGAKLRVAMTASATRFVGPITFTGLTGQKTVTDLWDPDYPGEIHVELADQAEVIVVAPATANLLARAAGGLADDVVLATLVCSDVPVVMAPAMHERMWRSPATQRNVSRLTQDGVFFVGPTKGALANGRIGMGRMADAKQIADEVEHIASRKTDLREKTILISAGPTLEDLDPVRFISNRSSGRMGYAIASAARARGASVILVTGPTQIPKPPGVEVVDVRSALEMKQAIDDALPRADAVIMTAAVADYRPAQQQPNKIKKSGENLSVELVKNPDILAELGRSRADKKARKPVLVGFAMETNDVTAYGRKKLIDKQVDLIVANEAAVGFGRDDTEATLISRDDEVAVPPTTKVELAHRILDRVIALFGAPRGATRNRRDLRPRARPRDHRRKGR